MEFALKGRKWPKSVQRGWIERVIIAYKCATGSDHKVDNCTSVFYAVAQESETSCPFRRPDTGRVQRVCNRCATQAILSCFKLTQGNLRMLKKAI